MDKLNVGIVGIGGRPSAFLGAIQNSKKAVLKAVCDINPDSLNGFTYDVNPIDRYKNYDEMLQKAELDLVIIGTPMPLHVSQAISALAENINVFSEVTAAVTMEEAKELVKAAESSKAQYMLGENCNYMKQFIMAAEMAKKGLFGEIFYARGEYLHNCSYLLNATPWRRKCFFETSGITYGTHSLGPILACLGDDRITHVSCTGSGSHITDEDGRRIADDTCVMLAKTAAGRLIEIRNELFSPRPYSLNCTLQGTKGVFESDLKGDLSYNLVSFKDGQEKWTDISSYEEEYLPDLWRIHAEAASQSGHEGSDYVMMADLINTLYEGKEVAIDIHRGMDMTLPGIVSRQSIADGGQWTTVPDSRDWR